MTNETAPAAESTIDDPADLTSQDYKAVAKRTIAEVKSDDVPGLAAGVAFKIFLALFPGLLAAAAIFGLVTTPAELAEMIDALTGVLPDQAVDVIEAPLRDLTSADEGKTGLAALLGVLGGVFAATSAAVSLMKALSRAYDVAETRKLLRQRAVALALTVALVVALLGVALLLIAGPQIQRALLGELPTPFGFLLGVVRTLLAIGLLVLLFAFVYWIGPNRDRPEWAWMSPGAALGVVMWLAISGLFTLYVQTAGNYQATYGALAGVAILMLWLQFSMLAMLFGAEFNAEVERRGALYQAVNAGAGFAVPAPSGGPILGDQEGGSSAVTEARVESAKFETVQPDTERTVELPDPLPAVGAVPPAPAQAVSTAAEADTGPMPVLADVVSEPRKAGAVAAAVMAAAVFLGFARRRSRR